MEAKLKKIKVDPVVFTRIFLNVNPFPYQERLLRDPSKRIVACMGRQTGKTHTIAMRAIHFVYTNKNMTVLITSPSLRQSMIMFDRIADFIYRNKLLREDIVRATRTLIQLRNGSKIIALPCSENLLRGYSANMVIMDESAFMPEEVITQVIMPMLATTDGILIMLSTPFGRDHVFYRAFMNPEYSVHKIKSSDCPLITPKFLKEQRENMTEMAYRMEYEAEFVEAAESYYPQDLIRPCVELAAKLNLDMLIDLEQIKTPLSGEFYAGVDLGKLQDFSVITVLERTPNDLRLRFKHEFPLETQYNSVIGEIEKANQIFRFQKILIDKTGVGEAVTEEIKNRGLTKAEGINFTIQSKQEMLGRLRIQMEQVKLALPYDRRLCTQINEQRFRYGKSGKLEFWHPEGAHDDQLWSLALAVFAAKEKPEPKGVIIKI